MCQTCVAKGTPCDYDVSPGQTRDDARREKMRRMRLDNASMLKIFWNLQTTPVQDAHDFVDFLRTVPYVDVPSMNQWFQDRLLQNDENDSGSSTTHDRSSSMGGDGMSPGLGSLNRPDTIEELAKTSHQGHDITVAELSASVNMFCQATGSLFYLSPKDHVASVLAENLVHIPKPGIEPVHDIVEKCSNTERGACLAELFGMAAIGALYLGKSRQDLSATGHAEYYCSVTKQLLEAFTRAEHLRSLKVYALLAMYSIIVRARVALVYIGNRFWPSVLCSH